MNAVKEIIAFFAIAEDQPELNRARFRVLVGQLPIMYGIVALNMWVVAATHFSNSPIFLTVVFPLIFSVLMVGRSIRFLRTDPTQLSDAETVKRLRAIIPIAGIFGAFLSGWSISLFAYGNALMQGYVVFFSCLTVLISLICLMHLFQAAVIISLTVVAPVSVHLLFVDDPIYRGVAFNMAVVVVAMLFIMYRFFGDFRSMIAQQKILLGQGDKLETLNHENQQLANLDSLTSLPNRRSFFARLDTLMDICRAERKPMVLGLLDLDGFKPINDVFGHPAGDRLLIEMGARLRDLLGSRATVFRLGGDEFGILMMEPGNDDDVLALGKTICSAVRVPFELREGTVQVAGTLGFAGYPRAASTPHDLFERADFALYHSKQHSKGHAVLFSFEHERIIREASNIEHRLREADLEKELSVVFQPIVDTQTGTTVGLEALARWDNPVLGRVSPDAFIRSAEQTGMISRLTAILLKKALDTASLWPQKVCLSFNLSALDLASSDSILRLMRIVENSAFPASRLVFEITESAVMQDFERANEALQLIRLLGAAVALDDFGTGFSSLSYVHQLPIDRLKVDRSFIVDIENKQKKRNVLRTIADLCRNLDMRVVVEGVETAAQLAVLDEIGCHLIQGFYFSKPLEAAQVQAFLTQEHVSGHEATG